MGLLGFTWKVQASNKVYRPVFIPFHDGGNLKFKMNNEGGEGLVINNKLQCSSSNRPEPGDVGFCGGRKKLENPEKNLQRKAKINNKLSPHGERVGS